MLLVGVTEGVEVGSRVAVRVKVGVNVRENVCDKVDVKIAVTVEIDVGEEVGSGERGMVKGVTTADTGTISMETWQLMTPSPTPIIKKRKPMR